MLVYSCADLFWATKIKAAAEAQGIQARPVRSVEMLDARLADSDVRGLIVELEPGEIGERGLALIRHVHAMRSTESQVVAKTRVMAFGSHVEVALLEEASRAGAEIVMSRGAFSGKMTRILLGLESGDAPPGVVVADG